MKTGNYPNQVVTRATELFNALKTFREEEKDLKEEVLFELLQRNLFDKFIGGIPMEFEEQEFSDLLTLSLIESAVEGLIEKGLIDSIENEEGEEILFATKLGKEYAANNNIDSSFIT